jgi:hypothetical protein
MNRELSPQPRAHRRRIVRILLAPWFPWAVIGLALLLVTPSLWHGWSTDDYYERWLLAGSPRFHELGYPPLDMFRFFDLNPERTQRMKEIGFVPWWLSPNIHAAFWRPATALTHIFDYTLWPDSPLAMHLHSLIWFALALAAVAALYRKVMGPTVAAALATLLYAIDDARATPVAWIANRNALLATCFGAMAIYAHVAWRRDGRRWGAVIGPIMLAAGLLSGEAGVGAIAYLLAYEITLAHGSWKRRLLCLAPCGLVLIAWRAAWLAQHYGIADLSFEYLDPLNDPSRFLANAVWRVPILLLSQWAFAPAELHFAFYPAGVAWMAVIAALYLLLVALALSPLVRRDATARFWTVGMLIATILAVAAPPMARNLMFVGIGAMGLLGQFFTQALHAKTAGDCPDFAVPGEQNGTVPFSAGSFETKLSSPRLAIRSIIAGWLALVHLVIAPAGLVLLTIFYMGPPGFAESMHDIPGLSAEAQNQDLVIVNHPMAFHVLHLLTQRIVDDQPIPRSTLTLASAGEPLSITRPDENSLLVHTNDEGSRSHLLDLYSRTYPYKGGETIELPAATVTVQTTTPDGRPRDVLFRFKRPLEDTSFDWIYWRDGQFQPFVPPKVGQTIDVPPSGLPF